MEFKDEIGAFLTKWWTYFCYIAIGLIGKFSYNMKHRKGISLWHFISSTGIACFFGYLATIYCVKYFPVYAPFVIPLVVLLSDKLMIFFMTRNWHNLFENLVSFIREKK